MTKPRGGVRCLFGPVASLPCTGENTTWYTQVSANGQAGQSALLSTQTILFNEYPKAPLKALPTFPPGKTM